MIQRCRFVWRGRTYRLLLTPLQWNCHITEYQ